MKFISLFSGVGGFDLALERTGHECVYANDIDKYCKIIYDKNFLGPVDRTKNIRGEEDTTRDDEEGKGLESTKGEGISTKNGQHSQRSNSNTGQGTVTYYNYKKHGLDNRSITDVTTEEIPDHDLLVGGFPCQSFSIAGKRGGFDDTRGTLFFEVARIVKQKQPRLLILENVKGLLSHDKGKTFAIIINTLDELGYDLQWQVLNSKDFGVPQNRERVFIVGHLRGTPRPEVFPIRRTSGKTTQIYGRVTGLNGHDYLRRVYSKEGASPTLPTGTGGNHYAKIYDSSVRRLTPLECERLQGFPDGWTGGVSDTQRYKMMGNAVTVNVIEEIIKPLDF